MREPGSATRRIAEKRLEEMQVPIKVAMEVGSNEAVKRTVANGLALGILSHLALEVDCAAGYLKTIGVRGLNCKRHFCVLHHKDKYLSRPQQAFLDLTKDLPYGLPPAELTLQLPGAEMEHSGSAVRTGVRVLRGFQQGHHLRHLFMA